MSLRCHFCCYSCRWGLWQYSGQWAQQGFVLFLMSLRCHFCCYSCRWRLWQYSGQWVQQGFVFRNTLSCSGPLRRKAGKETTDSAWSKMLAFTQKDTFQRSVFQCKYNRPQLWSSHLVVLSHSNQCNQTVAILKWGYGYMAMTVAKGCC